MKTTHKRKEGARRCHLPGNSSDWQTAAGSKWSFESFRRFHFLHSWKTSISPYKTSSSAPCMYLPTPDKLGAPYKHHEDSACSSPSFGTGFLWHWEDPNAQYGSWVLMSQWTEYDLYLVPATSLSSLTPIHPLSVSPHRRQSVNMKSNWSVSR